MRVSAIITARGNNTLKDKNIMIIKNKPLISYNICAAKNAKLVDNVYVTTECPKIKTVALRYGAKIIDRPKELATPESPHKDTIFHAVEQINAEIVVILMGNTAMVDSALIDQSIDILLNNDCDSVMSVWEAQDDHPHRASLIRDGFIQNAGYGGMNKGTNRQSYPKRYFHDQGLFTFRLPIKESDKISPWVWMGEKCIPIIRPWIAGRDIHNDLDIWVTEQWLSR